MKLCAIAATALCAASALAANRGLVFEPAGKDFKVQQSTYRMTLTGEGQTLTVGKPGQIRQIKTRMMGASAASKLRPGAASGARINYLLGSQSEWRTGEKSYESVRYEGIYPGVDLVFYGSEAKLEYDFVVKPGADPRSIAVRFEGTDSLALDAAGDLVLKAGSFETRWAKPVVYQQRGTKREAVSAQFVLAGNQVRFALGAYDPSRELVIDPVLTYATYTGGTLNEAARSVVSDSQGNVYIAGFTTSDNLQKTAGRVQTAYAGGTANLDTGDGFIAKYDSTGALQWITYLGGRADDVILDMAVDAQNNIYVTGFTNSTNFPVSSGAYQSAYKGGGTATQYHQAGDAFVTKLNSGGTSIVYSTYLGGSRDERGVGIAVDAAGNAYIGGTTISNDLPVTAGVVQSTYGGGAVGPNEIIEGGDGFIAKLNASGSGLLWLTYLGGNRQDGVGDIAVDGAGDVYVTGQTLSGNFPTTAGAFQRTYGGQASSDFQQVFPLGDAFVTKLNPTGTSLVYSTFLGGSRDETGAGIAVDKDGNAYIAGLTSSTNFPTSASAPYKTYKGPASAASYFVYGDAFVTKVNPSGSALVYSTLLGGTLDDSAWGIALDKDGNAWISGVTNSADLPLSADAQQKAFGGRGGQTLATGDAFVAKLNAAGTAFTYTSYFGGGRDDGAGGITIDGAGNIWITGSAMSTNLIPAGVAGAAQTAFGGGAASPGLVNGDAFLAKITDPPAASPVKLTRVANAGSYDSTGVAPGEMVVLFGESIGPATLTLAEVDSATGKVKTTLADTRVLFDGVAAPVVYALAGQTAVVVPYAVAGKSSTQVTVEYKGQASAPLTMKVVEAHPGLFTRNAQGFGQGAIFNQDGTPNTVDNRATNGSIVVLFGTGEGQTNPAGVDGKVAATEFPKPVLPETVTVAGKPAQVLYVGAIPGNVAGAFQVNIVLPELGPGEHEVKVKFGATAESQAKVTVAVQ